MRRHLKIGLVSVMAAACGVLLTSGASFAQDIDQSCFLAPAKLPASEIDGFLANPNKFLTDEPVGGLPMANKARSLGGSSMKAVEALINLTKSANAEQKSAIGSGLSRVASACGATNPDYAAKIQQLVASLGDSSVITAFMSASGDVQTAAVGGAGGAGGGVGGGATGTNSTQRGAANNAAAGTSATTTNSGTYSAGSADGSDVSPI